MSFIAWRMLVGDTTKYLSLVVGLTFSVLLITQQGSIFVGIMERTYNTVTDIPQARVWVMDPAVQYPDDIRPLKDTDLHRVRGVPGVEWAVPLFKSTGRARARNGQFQVAMIIGLDYASLIGAPVRMIEGKVTDLWSPDAVIVDDLGARRLGGVRVGDTLELNDRRALIVGICRIGRTFNSFPVIYTSYTRATRFVPRERHLLSFVLAAPRPGVGNEELARRIERETGLGAFTTREFAWRTVKHYARNTGIVINFGITVFLGFLVGLAVAAQTFYTFALENVRHFGTLKAMGATRGMLARMVLLQAGSTGAIAFGLGVGGAELFGIIAGRGAKELAFKTPPELLWIALGLTLLLIAAASLICLRKVLRIEPAIVFRG